MTTTTELTRRAETISSPLISMPSLDEARGRLNELIEREDLEALDEIRVQAAAHQEYEQRRLAKDRADYFGRLKVLAEASLGAIDIARTPTDWSRRNGSGPPFEIGGEAISQTVRLAWRFLAIGQQQGLLEPVLEQLADDPSQDIGTYSVRAELRKQGVGWVKVAPLRQAVNRQSSRAGSSRRRTLKDLGERIGVAPDALGKSLGIYSSHHRQDRMRWGRAAEIAKALQLDRNVLQPAPRARRTRRRAHPRLRKLTGGRWDETYSRLRKTLDEFASVAGEAPKWDDAYAHFYALEEIIGKAMKRG